MIKSPSTECYDFWSVHVIYGIQLLPQSFFGVLKDEQKAHFNNYHKTKIIITKKN